MTLPLDNIQADAAVPAGGQPNRGLTNQFLKDLISSLALKVNTTALVTAIDALLGSTAWQSGGSGSPTFGSLTGAVADNAPLVAALALKANAAGAVLTGVPTAPTAALGTNTTQLATMAAVQAEIAALVASSPAALNTLNELAAALGNDANFSATLVTSLAGKANVLAPVTLTVNTALTAALHANRTLRNSVAGLVHTINNDATGLWSGDDSIDIQDIGVGTHTLVQGTAALTTVSGTSADSTTAIGKRVQAQRTAANAWSTLSPAVVSSGGGGWGAPVQINADTVLTRAAHGNRTLVVATGYRNFTLNDDATAGWQDGDRIYAITPGTFTGFGFTLGVGVTVAAPGATSSNLSSGSTGANALMLERTSADNWQVTSPINPITLRGGAAGNFDFTLTRSQSGVTFIKDDAVAHTVTIPLESSVNFDPASEVRFANSGTLNLTIARTAGVTLWDNGVNQNLVLTPGQCARIFKAFTDTWFVMRG